MTYDDWKTRTPDDHEGETEFDDGADHSSENDPDFCYECQRDVDDCECDLDGPDDYDEDDRERGCVLGKDCLAADPFHRSDECFDVAMAESYMAPGPNGFNGDCNCRFIP